MKMQYRLTFIILSLLALSASAMDYGLRFKSHSFPGSKRTSLFLSNGEPFKFEKQISIEFDVAFYDTPHFGQLCSVILDNGSVISIVSALDNDNDYNPAVVINGNVFPINKDFIATKDNPAKLKLSLDKESNKAILKYGNENVAVPFAFSGIKSANIVLGATERQPAVAPADVKDVRLFIDGRNTNHWELASHKGDSTIDCIANKIAVTHNPRWIIDDHFKWKEIFSLNTKDEIQTAFNPANSTFYILSDKSLETFNPKTGEKSDRHISADNRVMKFSNHLIFDSVSNSLISYNLKNQTSSRLDLNNLTWNTTKGDDAEPYFHNHSFASDGRYAYTFGGYGFYLFNNSAFKIDLLSGEISPLKLSPLPEPRTSSASAVVGDKLYIFGGYGNSIGKQEIPSETFYDLWEYDLNTLKGKKLWEKTDVDKQFFPSSSMYLSPRENAFYMASSLHGGNMIKVYIDRPEVEFVTESINTLMEYRDCVFDLYRDEEKQMYYFVIDKRLDDFSHDYKIYEVTYPFNDNPSYQNLASMQIDDSDSGASRLWIFIAAGCLIAIVAGFAISKRKKTVVSPSPSPVQPEVDSSSTDNLENKEADVAAPAENGDSTPDDLNQPLYLQHMDSGDTENHQSEKHHDAKDESVQPQIPETVESEATENTLSFENTHVSPIFDRSKSAISLLGEFNVRDKNGTDITASFSSRLKDLIILLILESERRTKGVRQQTIDELIWNDKDEKSVKNNRNVYMRKLRVLLTEIGDFEIIFEKGYYIINNKDVLCDYVEVNKRIAEMENSENVDKETIEQTLELLLYGPLLPHTSYTWLDNFKSTYSDSSLNMLFKLLKYEKATNPDDDRLLYRIAETISCHDPLSEEALELKCKILAKRKMAGLAKKIYDSFCREYRESFGQEFETSFASLYNKS